MNPNLSNVEKVEGVSAASGPTGQCSKQKRRCLTSLGCAGMLEQFDSVVTLEFARPSQVTYSPGIEKD
ncbi:hypothetical protein RRG08_006507 [Elysia crispata]|uniref:Uncharacterized protein n=1 Tax=Elysia crispata TaxID=231223 RepID=A0AAE1CVZ4_9GAST|nr:hypothetical protein RRG08_006507 [Elysia crispata]